MGRPTLVGNSRDHNERMGTAHGMTGTLQATLLHMRPQLGQNSWGPQKGVLKWLRRPENSAILCESVRHILAEEAATSREVREATEVLAEQEYSIVSDVDDDGDEAPAPDTAAMYAVFNLLNIWTSFRKASFTSTNCIVPTASAQPMSRCPLWVFHPGIRRHALQNFPIVMPIPIPELASEKARTSRWGCGGVIGLDTWPVLRVSQICSTMRNGGACMK
ncbi:hypothetical protein BJ138DRAFT_1107277 [Hygrophoropsis aurantiaca]|uniref:Uncharacterized protein n=1 Tax=Hygrophoropsis aurantiaca TaxID=72124 RepID=A0ACB7ZSY1_9AGAM|nr:hypothetical protein BJ138DRAFT_1107277 [Hygrophoropsis aurantiaca]